jgi:hypothetical protein
VPNAAAPSLATATGRRTARRALGGARLVCERTPATRPYRLGARARGLRDDGERTRA